jgi:hypothetical protein
LSNRSRHSQPFSIIAGIAAIFMEFRGPEAQLNLHGWPGDAAFNVCPGSGTGTFSCPSKPKCNFDSGYISLLAADLNGDGKSDVIAPLGAGAQPRPRFGRNAAA